MIQFKQFLFFIKFGIQVTGNKMNEEGRILNILQNNCCFGRNIGRKLDDLCGEVFDIGDIGLKILILWCFFFIKGFNPVP